MVQETLIEQKDRLKIVGPRIRADPSLERQQQRLHVRLRAVAAQRLHVASDLVLAHTFVMRIECIRLNTSLLSMDLPD